MTPYNKILTLHHEGCSNSEISRQTGITRKTVIDVLKRVEIYSLTYPPESLMSDTEIHRFLHPKKEKEKRMPNIDETMFCLRLPEQSIAKLWKFYSDECLRKGLKPYSKSMYQNIIAEQRHKYSEKAFENAIEVKYVKNVIGDKQRSCFFARNVDSNYVTVVRTDGNKTRDWIHGLINVLHSFGGLPEECRYIGNIPKAVRDETEDCLKYYGIHLSCIKAKEAGSGFQQWISETIRNLNDNREEAVSDVFLLSSACCEYNRRPYYHSRSFSREQANEHEIRFLRSFPEQDYDLIEYTEVSPQLNYHVEIDGMYYSIPFDFRHERLIAYISDASVEIYYNDTMIAVHDRLIGSKGQYSTQADHVPADDEIPWGETSGKSLRKWAMKIGPYTGKTIDYWLKKKQFEVQAYKMCNAVLHLSVQYGSDALESACAFSWANNAVTYQIVTESCKSRNKGK